MPPLSTATADRRAAGGGPAARDRPETKFRARDKRESVVERFLRHGTCPS